MPARSKEISPASRRVLTLLALALCALVVWLANFARAPEFEPGALGCAPAPRAESTAPAALSSTSTHDRGTSNDALTPPGPALEAARADPAASRLSGRVLDARTGEPVPDVEVEVSFGAATVLANTDGLGLFVLGDLVTHGAVQFAVRDAGELVFTGDHVHTLAESVDLAVPIGPTYPIDMPLTLSPSHAGWRAQLRESGRRDGEAGAIVTGEALALEKGAAEREWSSVPLRPGNPPWIRFARVEHEPTAELHAQLVLDNAQLGLLARRGVAGTVGIQPKVALLSAERIASFAGALVWPAHAGLPPRSLAARVLLIPQACVTESPGTLVTWDATLSDARGAFRFERVSPGAKRIVVEPLGAGAIVSDDVQLFAGENGQHLVTLAPSLERDALAHVRPDDELEGVELILRAVAGGSCAGAASVSVQSDALRTHDRRAAAEIPPGYYAVRVLGEVAAADARNGTLKRELPPPDWTLAPADMRDYVPWSPIVVDAHSGTPLDRAYVWFGVFAPGGPQRSAAEPSRARTWILAPGAGEWSASAPGFRVAHETFDDLATLERAPRIELVRGFGAEILVREREPVKRPMLPHRRAACAPPVPHVVFLVNGGVVGESDADGRVLIGLPRAPARVALRAPGWKLVAVEPLPGAPRDVACIAWLERDR